MGGNLHDISVFRPHGYSWVTPANFKEPRLCVKLCSKCFLHLLTGFPPQPYEVASLSFLPTGLRGTQIFSFLMETTIPWASRSSSPSPQPLFTILWKGIVAPKKTSLHFKNYHIHSREMLEDNESNGGQLKSLWSLVTLLHDDDRPCLIGARSVREALMNLSSWIWFWRVQVSKLYLAKAVPMEFSGKAEAEPQVVPTSRGDSHFWKPPNDAHFTECPFQRAAFSSGYFFMLRERYL